MDNYAELLKELRDTGSDLSYCAIEHGCCNCALSSNITEQSANAIESLQSQLTEARADAERLREALDEIKLHSVCCDARHTATEALEKVLSDRPVPAKEPQG